MNAADGPLRDRMIFLVGARRSGTNWLQRVVGAHPDVALVPSETYLFSRGIKPLRERLHHGVLGSPGTGFVHADPEDTRDMLRGICDRIFLPFLRAVPGATRLAERTPEHVTCLDLIGEIYPDAWFVHIVRDGRDVVRSLVGQPWATAPATIEEAAEEWRSYVEAGETAGRALPRYRTVRYEEMLADPGSGVPELYRWLGLAVTDEIVKAALDEAGVGFNADPAAPRIASGKWREQFTPADLDAFMRVAGDTLERLGFEAGPSSASRPGGGAPRARRSRLRLGRRDRKGTRQRELVSQLTEAQRNLDRIVSALVTRRIDRLRDVALESIWVRVVTQREEWKGRGEAAWDRLAATIETDPALDGRQIAGDLHAGSPTSTAILTFAGDDGAKHVRTVAVLFQGERLARLTYYCFPLASES